jgi:alkylation response protein AidB-like acyl-CoA dehydrogenase
MFDLHLSEEQWAIRETVRDFVSEKLKPAALRPQRLEPFEKPLLMDLLDEASALGLRALTLPEEMGGAGADALTAAIVAEELGAGDPDLALALGETWLLGGLLAGKLMSEEQRQRFLPQFLDDSRYHLGYAGHEPQSEDALGANYHRPSAGPGNLKTRAVRAGNGEWIVNGEKDRVLNAPIAKLFAVEVDTDPALPEGKGVGTLLIPRDAPGLRVSASERASACSPGCCGSLDLRDCRVPADALLAAGAALKAAREAPQVQAIALGVGRAAYEAALDYVKLRVQGGRRLVEHQAIGIKLADMAVRLAAARGLIWHAAWALDHPDARGEHWQGDLPLATAARVYTAEAVYRVAKDAAECFGAMGVMRDMPLQKYVSDALVFLHSGNGNSDAKLRVAEALAGYRRP